MMLTGFGMLRAGVSANLMSLGALDFGLIVDGAVIIVENALRRLAEQQPHEGRLLSVKERLATVAAAARELQRPAGYGQARPEERRVGTACVRPGATRCSP